MSERHNAPLLVMSGLQKWMQELTSGAGNCQQVREGAEYQLLLGAVIELERLCRLDMWASQIVGNVENKKPVERLDGYINMMKAYVSMPYSDPD